LIKAGIHYGDKMAFRGFFKLKGTGSAGHAKNKAITIGEMGDAV